MIQESECQHRDDAFIIRMKRVLSSTRAYCSLKCFSTPLSSTAFVATVIELALMASAPTTRNRIHWKMVMNRNRTGTHGQCSDGRTEQDPQRIEHTCRNRNGNYVVDGSPEQVLL